MSELEALKAKAEEYARTMSRADCLLVLDCAVGAEFRAPYLERLAELAREAPELAPVHCRRCGVAVPDVRSLAELAREALQVQDACNLSGVVLAYARSMVRLRELHDHWGTERVNTHPIAQLWADKCASLAGCQAQIGAEWAVLAYRQVRELAAVRELPQVVECVCRDGVPS